MAKDIPVHFVPLLIKKKKKCSYCNIWSTPKVPVRWAKSNIRSINRGGTRGSWKYNYHFLSTTIVFVRESYDEKTAAKSLDSISILPKVWTRHEKQYFNKLITAELVITYVKSFKSSEPNSISPHPTEVQCYREIQ